MSEARTDYEERFARLRALRPNWDSYGARTIAEAAIVTVRHLLEDAAIVPTSKGGVQIEWHRHGADIEIEVAPSGDVESVFWAQGDVTSGAVAAGAGDPSAAVRSFADALHDAIIQRVIDEPRHTAGERMGGRMACSILREMAATLGAGDRPPAPSAVLLAALEAHRRYHRTLCGGDDDCYVCQAEDTLRAVRPPPRAAPPE